MSLQSEDVKTDGKEPSRDLLLKRAMIYNLKEKEKAVTGFQQESNENLA